jgi:hypothetical protein
VSVPPNRWVVVAVLVALAVGSAACGGSALSAPTTTTTTTTTTASGPLTAPKTTPAQDAAYLTDVAKADPGLATYVQQQGNVALKAMLTDGTAFCAFLRRGGGLDTALVDVATGAQSVEPQTHLPPGVATFNTLEAVALLELCPSEQSLVPPSVRTKVHRLGVALGKPTV